MSENDLTIDKADYITIVAALLDRESGCKRIVTDDGYSRAMQDHFIDETVKARNLIRKIEMMGLI